MLVGTHKYGFTEWLTGESRLELQLDQQAGGVGASVLLPRIGVLSAGVMVSNENGSGPGLGGTLDYEYRGPRLNLGLRTRYASGDFRQIGQTSEQPKWVNQASLGFNLAPFGRIGLLAVHRNQRKGADSLSFSGNYSIPLGPGTIMVNAVRSVEPRSNLSVLAGYSVALGETHSSSSFGELRDGELRGRSQLNKSRGASDMGLSYRLSTEAGGDNPRYFSGNADYQGQYAGGRVDVVYQDSDVNLRVNPKGSVTYLDGKVRPSRRIGRAFGLVALPGYPDVRVYLNNRDAGTTDGDGYLLLPGLRPYERNRVTFDVEDLPLDADVKSNEIMAVPFDRSGVAIDFDVSRNRTVIVQLLGADESPLPPGLLLRTADGLAAGQVARDGVTYVSGEVVGDFVLEGSADRARFSCSIDVPTDLPDEPLPDLGFVQCRESAI